jgi:hypothetical protein
MAGPGAPEPDSAPGLSPDTGEGAPGHGFSEPPGRRQALERIADILLEARRAGFGQRHTVG